MSEWKPYFFPRMPAEWCSRMLEIIEEQNYMVMEYSITDHVIFGQILVNEQGRKNVLIYLEKRNFFHPREN